MHHYKAFIDTSKLYQIAREEYMFPWRELGPIITQEASKRIVTILDTKYKKTDLPAIVSDNCSYLDSLKQAKLLALLEKQRGMIW